jgi:DNA-binding Xre family transcriptional regulator
MERRADVPSIRQVALAAGLGYNTVFAIYHNKATRVDLATLDALASALRCDPGELIGRPGRRSSRGR